MPLSMASSYGYGGEVLPEYAARVCRMGVRSHEMIMEQDAVEVAVHGLWKGVPVETELRVGAMTGALEQDGVLVVGTRRNGEEEMAEAKVEMQKVHLCDKGSWVLLWAAAAYLNVDLVLIVLRARGCHLQAAIRSMP